MAVPDEHLKTARELLACCYSWEPDARILGSVRAGDAASFISAVLLASAPPSAQQSQRERELLEALEGCIEHMEWSTEPGKAVCSAARTAIAKANAAPSAQEQAEHKAALEDIAAALRQSPEWGADQLNASQQAEHHGGESARASSLLKRTHDDVPLS